MRLFGSLKLFPSIVNFGRRGIISISPKFNGKRIDLAKTEIVKSEQNSGQNNKFHQHSTNKPQSSNSYPWLFAFLSAPVLAYISADDQRTQNSTDSEERYYIKTTKADDYVYEEQQESKLDHSIDFIILRPDDEPNNNPGIIADIGSLTIGFAIGYAMERSLNLLIWGISAQLLVVYTIAKWGYIRVNWDRLNPLLKYELLVGDKPRHFFNDIFVKNWQLKASMVTGFVLGMNLVNLM